MSDRFFAAISRVTGEILMIYSGSYPEALDTFDRRFGTAEDYTVEPLPGRIDPPQPVRQVSLH